MAKNEDTREFIRHYMEPMVIAPKKGKYDPPPELLKEIENIAKLLREGKTAEVIGMYDSNPPYSPESTRLALSVACAYIQEGDNLERAIELIERAIKYYSKQGPDSVRLAMAYAQMARIAYRLEGFEQAMHFHNISLSNDNQCEQAWINSFCFTSVEMDEMILDDLVDRFISFVPDFSKNKSYRHYFIEDAQLTWARRQTSFKDKILSRLQKN